MNENQAPESASGVRAGQSPLQERLARISDERLRRMRRGVEKESLRAQPGGSLALTPHPAALGSALTHPSITTDFSESQVELVTSALTGVDQVLQQLTEIHQFTYGVMQELGDDMLWVSSMPCGLPTDETIPIGRYGSSNVGRAKSVYRMGLGHRYGRRMQTISGIHYNWSLPDVNSEQYFALIRNFRRQAFLLLYLFGASPSLCSSFVSGREHELKHLAGSTMYMPHGTSLRMGRLGYQSDAQASLAVSYNSLEGYAASLQDALTRPYPAYEKVGIRNPGGDYNQLATTLLQIENEFYGTIRPKRVNFPGERPLHALRERGVEYIEVRLMDLDPFVPVGITAQTMHFLDIFLLQCLLTDSPADSPEEIAALARNQHRTAARGREPGLKLERAGIEVGLTQWGHDILSQCAPIAKRLDQVQGNTCYSQALESARTGLNNPDSLPSARVLAAMADEHDNSFIDFVRSRSLQTRDHLLGLHLPADRLAHYRALTDRSVAEQIEIELSDSLPFEIYRQQYVAPERLNVGKRASVPA
jgi:glutamate--cysteine ligase